MKNVLRFYQQYSYGSGLSSKLVESQELRATDTEIRQFCTLEKNPQHLTKGHHLF